MYLRVVSTGVVIKLVMTSHSLGEFDRRSMAVTAAVGGVYDLQIRKRKKRK